VRSRSFILGTLLLCGAILLPAGGAPAQSDAETRVLEYLREHVQPGHPLVVTDLYNNVFTKPEERKALNKLYGAFFRIPLFLAQYQEKFGAPPRLKVISEQFDLPSAEAADVLVRVMESDPRVPSFLTRDPQSGEILSVDVTRILNDPRFGKAVEHQLGGWEGRSAPAFKLPGLEGEGIDSTALKGRVILLYTWFTGCPPCMKETPELVALSKEYPSADFIVVGANADRLLGLNYDDSVRHSYVEKQGIAFPVVNWTRESDTAYGSISIFPTLFLIGRDGIITNQWVGYVGHDILHRAISEALARPPASQ
jgi:thiol-disulfide isomerase/thioredoxin